MVTIIDYGVGNLASIQNMLKKVGVSSQVSRDFDVILSASKIILPGVGAFDAAMEKINDLGLSPVIRDAAQKGSRILGICLGAQLLLEHSEEGVLEGLSLIKGKCAKFDAALLAPLKVPHMGWNDVHFKNPSHPLSRYNDMQPRFYFTHSYYLQCDNLDNVLATAVYGHEFACGIAQENIVGLQFHPEKSHVFGAQLFANFAGM